MIEEVNNSKRLICDSCGRQIVNYTADDKFIIGPRSKGIMVTGVNKHACHACIPYEIEWEKACIADEIEENEE